MGFFFARFRYLKWTVSSTEARAFTKHRNVKWQFRQAGEMVILLLDISGHSNDLCESLFQILQSRTRTHERNAHKMTSIAVCIAGCCYFSISHFGCGWQMVCTIIEWHIISFLFRIPVQFGMEHHLKLNRERGASGRERERRQIQLLCFWVKFHKLFFSLLDFVL